MVSIAAQPSEITLPAMNDNWPTVLAFLCHHFARIPAEVWLARVRSGKVFWYKGDVITEQTPFLPSRRVCYYREVVAEPLIPLSHQILYQDEHILVADKPHFLPVTPGGDFVNECLLQRLKDQTGITALVPLHRLDRDTAGLVMFSVQPASRAAYYELFSGGGIEKSYQARAYLGDSTISAQQWQVRNRIEKAEPRFLNKICAGAENAWSTITLCKVQAGVGHFQLTPHTGKTHQLRLHMQSLGWPILNDRYYPTLLPKNTSDFSQPLQLLAAELRFIDPLTGAKQQFCSLQQLNSLP